MGKHRTKQCSTRSRWGCGMVKSLRSFHKASNSSDGRYYICKECANAKARYFEKKHAGSPGKQAEDDQGTKTHKVCGPTSSWGCRKLLPLSDYQKRSQSSDGKHYICKKCVARMHKAGREKNLEEYKRRCREWKKNNPEKAQASRDNWKKENPEKAREVQKTWRRKNPELVRECRKRGRHRKAASAIEEQMFTLGIIPEGDENEKIQSNFQRRDGKGDKV